MNIINLFKKGSIEKIHLDMPLVEFEQTKLSKEVTEKIDAFDDEFPEFILYTSLGIEIRFFSSKIESISIDPNYKHFALNNLKINRNTSLTDLIKSYHKNDIQWKFNSRDKENECEVITTQPKVSIIFTFDKDEFWMSKIKLCKI